MFSFFSRKKKNNKLNNKKLNRYPSLNRNPSLNETEFKNPLQEEKQDEEIIQQNESNYNQKNKQELIRTEQSEQSEMNNLFPKNNKNYNKLRTAKKYLENKKIPSFNSISKKILTPEGKFVIIPKTYKNIVRTGIPQNKANELYEIAKNRRLLIANGYSIVMPELVKSDFDRYTENDIGEIMFNLYRFMYDFFYKYNKGDPETVNRLFRQHYHTFEMFPLNLKFTSIQSYFSEKDLIKLFKLALCDDKFIIAYFRGYKLWPTHYRGNYEMSLDIKEYLSGNTNNKRDKVRSIHKFLPSHHRLERLTDDYGFIVKRNKYSAYKYTVSFKQRIYDYDDEKTYHRPLSFSFNIRLDIGDMRLINAFSVLALSYYNSTLNSLNHKSKFHNRQTDANYLYPPKDAILEMMDSYFCGVGKTHLKPKINNVIKQGIEQPQSPLSQLPLNVLKKIKGYSNSKPKSGSLPNELKINMKKLNKTISIYFDSLNEQESTFEESGKKNSELHKIYSKYLGLIRYITLFIDNIINDKDSYLYEINFVNNSKLNFLKSLEKFKQMYREIKEKCSESNEIDCNVIEQFGDGMTVEENLMNQIDNIIEQLMPHYRQNV